MIKAVAILALVGAAYGGVVYNAAPAYAPVATYAHAPVATYAHAPVATYAHAPVATYAHAPIVKTIAQPAYATYAHAPIVKAIAQPTIVKTIQAEPFDAHPQYNFGYSVSDSLTGDHHSQTESRDGDVVKGQYSLVEADGAIRTVTYTADAINGFNAVVDRSAPTVVKAVAPVVKVAQPAYATYAHAPIVKAVHAAPAYATYAHAPVVKAIHAAPAYATYAHATPVVKAVHAAPAYATYAHAPIHHF